MRADGLLARIVDLPLRRRGDKPRLRLGAGPVRPHTPLARVWAPGPSRRPRLTAGSACHRRRRPRVDRHPGPAHRRGRPGALHRGARVEASSDALRGPLATLLVLAYFGYGWGLNGRRRARSRAGAPRRAPGRLGPVRVARPGPRRALPGLPARHPVVRGEPQERIPAGSPAANRGHLRLGATAGGTPTPRDTTE